MPLSCHVVIGAKLLLQLAICSLLDRLCLLCVLLCVLLLFECTHPLYQRLIYLDTPQKHLLAESFVICVKQYGCIVDGGETNHGNTELREEATQRREKREEREREGRQREERMLEREGGESWRNGELDRISRRTKREEGKGEEEDNS